MRDDTLLFIITHKRADRQQTLEMLKKGRYDGKIFLVVDDADPDLQKYQKRYGDMVLVFSKEDQYQKTDTYTNVKNLKGAVYVRNACIEFAQQRGCKFYFVCDDDISRLDYKNPKSGKMETKRVQSVSKALEALVNWLEVSEGIKAVGISEAGAFIGGINQDVRAGVKYAMSKFMLYRTENPMEYKGLVYEDSISPMECYQRGEISYSFMGLSQQTPPNNTSWGGCEDLYISSTTYVNYFYLVMSRPDALKLTVRKGDFNYVRNRNAVAPKIISGKWRKADAE